MNNQVLPVGSRVRVISYSPFRGLIGTIRTVDTKPDLEADEAFCFYLVELEGLEQLTKRLNDVILNSTVWAMAA
jgi:hypothetical protein